MGQDDSIWRALVNSLPEIPSGGQNAPDLENLPKQKIRGRKFKVQKIVTEIYVYTDLEDNAFSEACFQELYLLGEMSEAKLKKLLAAEARRREREG
jgi:hypothetical protein